MKPIIKKVNGDKTELCAKCGEKVGFYQITGKTENSWNYKQHKFCPNCGEIIDRCKGAEKLYLKELIIEWLDHEAKFANSASEIELKMQCIFTDWMEEYDGKERDAERILENCKTVEEVFYFVQKTTDLEINRYWNLREGL